MNERLKKLRKELDMTQQEFAEGIGIKRNTIATYESGRNEPIDAVISLICTKYNVNENWLRTGEGDMFVKLSYSDEIAQFVGQLMTEEDDSFKKRLVSGLAALDETGWKVLEDFLDSIHFNSHPHEEDDDVLVKFDGCRIYFNSHPHEEDDKVLHQGRAWKW